MQKKEGLIIDGQGKFKSQQQIRVEHIEDYPSSLKHLSPLPVKRTFGDNVAELLSRQKTSQEFDTRSPNFVKVRLPHNSMVSFIGDAHIGAADTDYNRLLKEVEAIANTPNGYVVTVGDLTDGFFWGGQTQSEEIMSLDEQHQVVRSLYDKLKGRVIAGVSGEHDSKWAARNGPDPYGDFAEQTGGHYIRGTAEIEVEVEDQSYNLLVAHKMPGHSMYNKNHPTFRAARFGIQGADILVSAHRHQKQVSQEAIREFGDKSRPVTHIALGPYKKSDEYSERNGYPTQTDNELGGVSVRLNGKKKEVEVDNLIVRAAKRWGLW